MTRPGKLSCHKWDSDPGPSALEADALTTGPTRRREVRGSLPAEPCRVIPRWSEVRGSLPAEPCRVIPRWREVRGSLPAGPCRVIPRWREVRGSLPAGPCRVIPWGERSGGRSLLCQALSSHTLGREVRGSLPALPGPVESCQ